MRPNVRKKVWEEGNNGATDLDLLRQFIHPVQPSSRRSCQRSFQLCDPRLARRILFPEGRDLRLRSSEDVWEGGRLLGELGMLELRGRTKAETSDTVNSG